MCAISLHRNGFDSWLPSSFSAFHLLSSSSVPNLKEENKRFGKVEYRGNVCGAVIFRCLISFIYLVAQKRSCVACVRVFLASGIPIGVFYSMKLLFKFTRSFGYVLERRYDGNE